MKKNNRNNFTKEELELRDKFAMSACIALINVRKELEDGDERSISWMHTCGVGEKTESWDLETNKKLTWSDHIAWEAYGIADAMLEARKK